MAAFARARGEVVGFLRCKARAALIKNTLVAEMNMGKLAVSIFQIELYSASGLRRAAAHLGDAVLEPLG